MLKLCLGSFFLDFAIGPNKSALSRLKFKTKRETRTCIKFDTWRLFKVLANSLLWAFKCDETGRRVEIKNSRLKFVRKQFYEDCIPEPAILRGLWLKRGTQTGLSPWPIDDFSSLACRSFLLPVIFSMIPMGPWPLEDTREPIAPSGYFQNLLLNVLFPLPLGSLQNFADTWPRGTCLRLLTQKLTWPAVCPAFLSPFSDAKKIKKHFRYKNVWRNSSD